MRYSRAIVKSFFGMLIALISAGSLLRAQGPVADPYSIGAALGGQGSCPVFISGVIPGSPAQRADIRGGDFLLAVGNTKVENVGHAADLLRSDNPGTVTVKLWRSGREIESVVGREKRSSILAKTGGKSVPAFQYFLTAREAETERLLPLGGRVVGRVFSPTRYPDNPEMFYPGFEIFVLRGPEQITIGGIEDGPASRAGAHSGDVILSVNGIPVSKKTLLELQRLFSSTRPESMRLEIDRLGSVRTFQFKLAKASDIARQNGWRLAGGRFIPEFADGADPLCFPSARDVIFDRTIGIPGTVTDGFVEAHWMEDGNSFWFAQGSNGETNIFKYDPLKQAKTLLFDAERVRAALAPLAGHEIPGKGLQFDRFTFLPGEKTARFSFENRDFILDLSSYSIQPVPLETPVEKDRHTPRFLRKADLYGPPAIYEAASPDGRFFLGSADGKLYLRSTADGLREPLTEEGTKDYAWDSNGALWAPHSDFVAVTKVDRRDVPLYPIVHWLKPAPEVDWVRLAYSGSAVPKREYYIIDVGSKKQVRINTGDGAVFFRAWRPDDSELLITRQGPKQLDFMAVDPKTGGTRLLFTETTKTYFDLALSLPNSPNFTLLPDNRRFLWLSERDGWNQIYLYDLNSGLIRKLTDDPRPVSRIVADDEKDGWVYYTAYGSEGRPYDFHLYRINLRGGKASRLTDATGQHDQSLYFSYLGAGKGEGIQISPSRQFFLDSHSDVNRPPQTDLRRADGELVEVLSKASGDVVQTLRPNPPEELTAKAADGKTDLFGVLYKPYDFDPKKKYPVLDAIYAGPQTTWVSRTFAGGTGALAQAYANLGFIVFTVDARGTPDRGKAFQDVVYGDFGRNEIPDHVSVLKQLAAVRPYLDMSRVGVFGGSFGGYFAIRAMLQAPDTFHVGVAAEPLSDLRQVSGSGLILLGPPEKNKEAYDFASNLRIAGNLKGHLLLIHGTSDVNAPLTATIQMIDALIRAGKPYDLVLLPDQEHAPSGPYAAYYMQAQKRYLVQHLNP
jgi:dipeptidyl aminopeptidase/acylaminoacyl peptidase